MNALARIAASPSRTFFAASVAFIAGVAAHAWDERAWSPRLLSAAALAFAVTAIGFRARPVARFFILSFCLAAAGAARFDAGIAGLPAPDHFPPGEHRFTGRLRTEPEEGLRDAILIMDRVFVFINERSGRCPWPDKNTTTLRPVPRSFSGGGSLGEGGSAPEKIDPRDCVRDAQWKPLPGRMELVARSVPPVRPGDVLAWRCRPDAAPADPAFASRRLLLAGVSRRCVVYGPPEKVTAGSAALGGLFKGKRRLRAAAAALLPEPESSLLLGLLLGDRRGLPADTVEAFRQTGTSHILAVSGYNVSRVTEVVIIAFALAGVRRRAAALLAAAAIVAFAVMVGGEASVVRAAVMGCAGLLATIMGRRYSGSAAVVLAAAAMLALNPFMLRHDVGFRLSFAAVLGLQCLGPPIARLLRRLAVPSIVRQTCADTLAATAATAPLILRDFGLFSAAGIPVNVVILPFVPWAMAAGALALACALVWPLAGVPAAFVAAALLRGIRTVVEVSAAVFPAWHVRISAATAVALYGLLISFWLAAKDRRDDYAP